MNNIIREVLPSLILAAGILILALASRFAFNHSYIEHDTMLRLVTGANGLLIAYFGNRAPKKVAPSVCAQQLSRFGGWSLVLSGLIYAGLWVFAPIPQAIFWGISVVVTGIVATLIYGLQLRAKLRTSK